MGAWQSAVDVPAHVLEYLRGQNTLTLATATAEGVPHAATLTYVNDGLSLYCWMRPEALTLRHIDENPAVAFAIDRYTADWSQTQGVQGSGQARMVLDPVEIGHIVAQFERKYPGLSGSRASNLVFFRVTPAQVRFIDNRRATPEGASPDPQTLGVEYHASLVYSVFRDLPRREVDAVAGHLEPLRVETGGVIVRQGAPADKFFIIIDGEVEVVRDGERVATLRAGQFFGEMAILRDIPRTATVRATAPTTLLTMEREAFRSLVAQSLATTQDFDQVVRERLGAAPAADQ